MMSIVYCIIANEQNVKLSQLHVNRIHIYIYKYIYLALRTFFVEQQVFVIRELHCWRRGNLEVSSSFRERLDWKVGTGPKRGQIEATRIAVRGNPHTHTHTAC